MMCREKANYIIKTLIEFEYRIHKLQLN